MDYDKLTLPELIQLVASRGIQHRPMPIKRSRTMTKKLRAKYITLLRTADDKFRFRFLDLYPEIRNRIYAMLLLKDDRTSGHPAILRVCKQINREATGILYGDNKFEVEIDMYGVSVTHACIDYYQHPTIQWPEFLRRALNLTIRLDTQLRFRYWAIDDDDDDDDDTSGAAAAAAAAATATTATAASTATATAAVTAAITAAIPATPAPAASPSSGNEGGNSNQVSDGNVLGSGDDNYGKSSAADGEIEAVPHSFEIDTDISGSVSAEHSGDHNGQNISQDDRQNHDAGQDAAGQIASDSEHDKVPRGRGPSPTLTSKSVESDSLDSSEAFDDSYDSDDLDQRDDYDGFPFDDSDEHDDFRDFLHHENYYHNPFFGSDSGNETDYADHGFQLEDDALRALFVDRTLHSLFEFLGKSHKLQKLTIDLFYPASRNEASKAKKMGQVAKDRTTAASLIALRLIRNPELQVTVLGVERPLKTLLVDPSTGQPRQTRSIQEARRWLLTAIRSLCRDFPKWKVTYNPTTDEDDIEFNIGRRTECIAGLTSFCEMLEDCFDDDLVRDENDSLLRKWAGLIRRAADMADFSAFPALHGLRDSLLEIEAAEVEVQALSPDNKCSWPEHCPPRCFSEADWPW